MGHHWNSLLVLVVHGITLQFGESGFHNLANLPQLLLSITHLPDTYSYLVLICHAFDNTCVGATNGDAGPS